ncbi:hypothetical protein B0I35DRAFT_46779 [Stachybotrys elegans]|uniref:Uncharacterized protein n=1 Tax=Stachybotrys elegans TaxID=80388 RepID=A0A8K0WXB0_9HYPO|nr:hypothetical protein B0I35DRAFT_46779 [Stachybotrys elegans]
MLPSQFLMPTHSIIRGRRAGRTNGRIMRSPGGRGAADTGHEPPGGPATVGRWHMGDGNYMDIGWGSDASMHRDARRRCHGHRDGRRTGQPNLLQRPRSARGEMSKMGFLFVKEAFHYTINCPWGDKDGC